MSAAVIVSENGNGRYQQTVIAGQHQFLADEPVSIGGSDTGPAPFDFIMAGLGACTSMTLRMYAERKSLPLTGIQVALTHEKIDLDGARRDLIKRKITLHGELTPETRQRLLEIAEKCPVHKTLSQGCIIDSTLETAE
jgi:putative redox protein